MCSKTFILLQHQKPKAQVENLKLNYALNPKMHYLSKFGKYRTCSNNLDVGQVKKIKLDAEIKVTAQSYQMYSVCKIGQKLSCQTFMPRRPALKNDNQA